MFNTALVKSTQRLRINSLKEAKAIIGTQNLHTVIPISVNKLITKPFFQVHNNQLETVTTHHFTPIDLENLVTKLGA